MNDIEVSSIDLVEGGNVFKQGHYLTLGYVPRDEKGETVDLSGKTLNVSLWGRKGVVFEAAATYSGGVIRFTFDKLVSAGDYTVEFTATSSTDAKYRKKFPTNQHSGRIVIKQSADDLGVVGIQVYTVAQLKAEQKALLDAAVSGFTVDSETKMARVSGSTTYTSLPARLEADKQATATQLAETANEAKRKRELEDLSPAVLAAIEGGEGTEFNLLSIPQDGSVSPEKTTFLQKSSNLFNKYDVVVGSLDSATGELVESPNQRISGFIPVNPGTTIIQTGVSRYYFYRQDGTYIQPYTATAAAYTLPATVHAIRLRIHQDQLDTAQLNEGSALLPYEPFGFDLLNTTEKPIRIKVAPESIGAGELKEDAVGGRELKDNSVDPEKTTFINVSHNLFNKNTVLLNKKLDTATGTIVDDDFNFVSDFIPIEPNETYTKQNLGRWVRYDKDKKYIGTTVTDTYNFTVLDHFARVVAFKENLDSAQVVKGSVPLPFEPHGRQLANEILPYRLRETPFDWLNVQNYFIEGITEGIFSGLNLPSKDDNTENRLMDYKTADFYAEYDALMAQYPEYITRTFLGNDASGTIPIYRYDFKPTEIEAHGDFSGRKFPKVIIVSGSHPEKIASWCLLQSMKQITEEWQNNELLETLRWNVHFIVVPAWAPWNFDNDTRWNSNLVNVGRNFPYEFEVLPENDPYYGGNEPLSEPESQYLHQILIDNKDALFHIDFHNFFNTDNFVWVSAKSIAVANVGAALVRQMSREWKKNHAEIAADSREYLGYITSRGSYEGHNASFAESIGIRGLTFEVSQVTPWDEGSPRHSSMAISRGTEAFINFLVLMLRYTVEEQNTIRSK